MARENKKIILKLKAMVGDASVRSFARKCGVPESTLRGYLHGKRTPRTDILKKIADFYEVPFTWLAFDTKLPIANKWKMQNIDNKDLEQFFKLDPEVIDIYVENSTVFPVVKTYDDEESQLHFYCIHCRTWHSHGRGDPEVEYQEGRGGSAGHRLTHCIVPNSPFKPNGIWLDVVGRYKDIKKKQKAQKTLLCPKCHSFYSAAFNACECGFLNNKRKSKYPELEKKYKALLDPLSNINPPAPQTATLVHDQPSGDASEDEEKNKFHQDMTSLLRMVTKWQEDEHGADSLTSWNFLAEFHKRFPELQEWIKKQKGTDNKVPRASKPQKRKTA